MTDLKAQAEQLIELDGKRTPGEWSCVMDDYGHHYSGGSYLAIDADVRSIAYVNTSRSRGFHRRIDIDEHKENATFIAHTANHAADIARAYLDKCAEVERLREDIALKIEKDAKLLRAQATQSADWLYNDGEHPTKSKQECQQEAERITMTANGMECAARSVRSMQALEASHD